MTNPVTSTSVATKGAEETAGSAPSFFKTMGSIEPLRVPHKTTPTKLNPTVEAISIQWAPYRLGAMLCQTPTRTKPMNPSTEPNNKPLKSSRRSTRHQSAQVISPTAIA